MGFTKTTLVDDEPGVDERSLAKEARQSDTSCLFNSNAKYTA